MPQKTLKERARHAKAAGNTMTEKKSDVRDTGLVSNHANKKSHGILRVKGFADRKVNVRSPPGEGSTARMIRSSVAADESENRRKLTVPAGASGRFHKDGTKKVRSLDRGTMPKVTVSGRKKKPSRMNVKGRGGPFKRSRIHGG